jgi:hypothetical protein
MAGAAALVSPAISCSWSQGQKKYLLAGDWALAVSQLVVPGPVCSARKPQSASIGIQLEGAPVLALQACVGLPKLLICNLQDAGLPTSCPPLFCQG